LQKPDKRLWVKSVFDTHQTRVLSDISKAWLRPPPAGHLSCNIKNPAEPISLFDARLFLMIVLFPAGRQSFLLSLDIRHRLTRITDRPNAACRNFPFFTPQNLVFI
jgi:hypothetical protein